jgi:hypothetical protein
MIEPFSNTGPLNRLTEQNPAQLSEMAIELYKSEKISLGRAAEAAGTSQEGFKKILENCGVKGQFECSLQTLWKRVWSPFLDKDENASFCP